MDANDANIKRTNGGGALLDASQVHSYCEPVKNITLSIDDEVYHAARVEAAKRKSSLSAVVRNYLRAFANGQAPAPPPSAEDADRKNREELVAALKKSRLVLGYRPTRERTYER
jgi:plasmid stability protein